MAFRNAATLAYSGQPLGALYLAILQGLGGPAGHFASGGQTPLDGLR